MSIGQDTVDKETRVSVCVVTYNQENYIRQCLQSIVDQETDFNFEVIVADDLSSDGTREIIQEFTDRFPEIVKPIFHEVNLGAYRNFVYVHECAQSQYVAHMDGDDFMLPGKLSAQVSCLDNNSDVSFAVHAVEVIGTNEVIGGSLRYPEKGTIKDLLELGTYFVNSSVMYRKKNEFYHPDGFEAVDYFFHIERAVKGYVFLDRRVFGCYRVHEQGISKDYEQRRKIEDYYEKAFVRALELGVNRDIVASGRLKRRMSFAIARYLRGDVDGYKKLINIEKQDYSAASTKHLLLNWTKSFPVLVGIYAKLRGLS